MEEAFGRRATDRDFIPLLGQQIQAVTDLTSQVAHLETQLKLMPTADIINQLMIDIRLLLEMKERVDTLWAERLENMGLNKARKRFLSGLWAMGLISFGVVVNDIGAFLGSAGRLLERFFSMMAGP